MMPLSARLAEVQLAVMLLTRLPAGRVATAPTIAAAAWAFPVVGAMVGGLASLALTAALWLGLPATMAAGLALLAGVLATGGLHEDGLADCADGFGGGRDRARKLDIMRDSRIGSYGALTLILSIGLRWQGLATLSESGSAGAAALIALAVSSRAGLPFALMAMPAARSDGMGRSASGIRPATALISAGLAALVVLVLFGPATTLWLIGVQGLVAFGFARLALRQVGGQTGDVLGAMQQLTEITGWLVLASLAGS